MSIVSFFSPAMFAGPRIVEIQKFRYHDNVTGAKETGLKFVPQSNPRVQFDTTHLQTQNDLCYL